MPKSWDRLDLAVPKFNDVDQFLLACGKSVVDEIITNINREQRPDGTPQKQNSENYRRAKQRVMGYTTPVKGVKTHGTDRSPYIARRSQVAWERIWMPPDKVLIKLNRFREEVARKLTDKGYWFVGITRKAEQLIADRTWKYLNNKFARMARGEDV